jgi:hypothetical protein
MGFGKLTEGIVKDEGIQEGEAPSDGTPAKQELVQMYINAVDLILHEGVDHNKYKSIRVMEPRVYIITNPCEVIEELGLKRCWMDFRVPGIQPVSNYGYGGFYNPDNNTLYVRKSHEFHSPEDFTFNYLKQCMLMLGYGDGHEFVTDYEEFKRLVRQYLEW